MAQFDTPSDFFESWWYAFARLKPFVPADVEVKTSTTFRFEHAGYEVQLSGTGFSYSGKKPTVGTVTSIEISAPTGGLIASGLSAPVATFYDAAFGKGGLKLLIAICAGDNTLTGTSGSDDLFPMFDGNDVANAGAGNDTVYGDAGNDAINGGNGFDTVSYVLSFLDSRSKKGIVVDLEAGTVKDGWGGTDKLTGIEGVIGSKLDDVLKGSLNGKFEPSDLMSGLKGADTIDGRSGVDWVLYSNDRKYGGNAGVVVDLGKGNARDGWGDKDDLRNIESAEGTAKDDTFTGDAGDNGFNGLAGNDWFDGGKGRDTVYYDSNKKSLSADAEGITVDLSREDKQVVDDLFGDKDTLSSIERIVGSQGRDVIKGDGGDNTFLGYVGADVLSGGGGRDTFEYGYFRGIAEFGDTITDFTSGKDRFQFNLKSPLGDAHFGLMDATVRFANAASAQHSKSCFFFDAAKEALYWDSDGNGSATALLVAKLPGVASLAAGDIVIA